jgi:hypothetical protein
VYHELLEPNTVSVSRILISEFCIDERLNQKQIGFDGVDSVYVYPAETFCLDLERNVATHHFEGSWVPNKKYSYKEHLHSQYYFSNFLRHKTADKNYYLKKIALTLSLSQVFKIFIYHFYYRFTPKHFKYLISYFRR